MLILFLSNSSHAITSDVSLAETAEAAELFLTDGVIITGNATGQPASTEDIRGKVFFYNTIDYRKENRVAK